MEIAFCNTKEGMHKAAMQLNTKAWALGCSCKECNKEFEEVLMINPEDKIKIAQAQANWREKEIYNEAIEDVAKYLELDKWHSLPTIVRNLKK